MNLEKLEDLVYKEKIELIEYTMQNTKARIIQNSKYSFIFIDRNQIENSNEEKCVLAEELGHYYYEATYSPHCQNLQLISKQEYRARKWAYNVLIPHEDLKLAIKNGIDNIYDLSEYFEVSCPFMEQCIQYYKDRGVICA